MHGAINLAPEPPQNIEIAYGEPSAELVDYLLAENAHTSRELSSRRTSEQELFEEILEARGGTISDSAALPFGDFSYFTSTVQGARHPLLSRTSGKDARPILVFDPNALLQSFPQAALGGIRISPDHRAIAFSVDLEHRGSYSLFIWNIEEKTVSEVSSGDVEHFEWGLDACDLFFTLRTRLRAAELAHRRCTEDGPKSLLTLADDREVLTLRKARNSGELVVSVSSPHQRSFFVAPPKDLEARLLSEPAYRGSTDALLLVHRQVLAILEGAQTIRLIARNRQTELGALELPERTALESGEVFENSLVFIGRVQFEPMVFLYQLTSRKLHSFRLPFGTERARILPSLSASESEARIEIVSLQRAPRIARLDVQRAHLLLPEGNKPDTRSLIRGYANSKDGTQVPFSLVGTAGTLNHDPSPLLLIGYGAYGSVNQRGFTEIDEALLKRGFRVAVAHIRGGGEGGKDWHEAARKQHKSRSFEDFAAVARRLIEMGYTTPETLFAYGKSAGGLAVAVSAARNPGLFKAIVLDRPLVDVLAAVRDENAPLYAQERAEWGDAGVPSERQFIESYSPREKLNSYYYPSMLVITALRDSVVPYTDVVTWFALLRRGEQWNGGVGRGKLLHTSFSATHEHEVDSVAQARLEAKIAAYLIGRLS